MKVFWSKVKVAELGNKLPKERNFFAKTLTINNLTKPNWFNKLDKPNQNFLRDSTTLNDFITIANIKNMNKDEFIKKNSLDNETAKSFLEYLKRRNETQINKDLSRDNIFVDNKPCTISEKIDQDNYRQFKKNLINNISYTQGMLTGRIYEVLLTYSPLAPLIKANEVNINPQTLLNLKYSSGLSYNNSNNMFCSVAIFNIGHRYAICHTTNIDKPIEEQELTIICTENINEFLPGGIKLNARAQYYDVAAIKNLIKNDTLVSFLKLDDFAKLEQAITQKKIEKCKHNATLEDYNNYQNEWYTAHLNLQWKCGVRYRSMAILTIATTLAVATGLATGLLFAPAALIISSLVGILALGLAVYSTYMAKKSFNNYKFFDTELREALNVEKQENTLSNSE